MPPIAIAVRVLLACAVLAALPELTSSPAAAQGLAPMPGPEAAPPALDPMLRGGDLIAAEFDARGMTARELRTIQIALGQSGDYNGLFDGEWGRLSQEALERWHVRSFGGIIVSFAAVGVLIGEAVEIETREGWRDVPVREVDALLRLPEALVRTVSREGFDRFWATPGDTLQVGVELRQGPPPTSLHDQLAVGADAVPYTVRRDDRLVTSWTLDGRRGFYIRSDLTRYGWITLLAVASDADSLRRMAVIVSGFALGLEHDWTRGGTPTLDRLFAAIDAAIAAEREQEHFAEYEPDTGDTGSSVLSKKPAAERATVEGAGDSRKSGEISGAGTGFFVGPTDVVTNHHVIDGCVSLEGVDGMAFDLIAADPDADLALLQSTRRSRVWLELARDREPALGSSVYVLGFPYFGVLSSDLAFTRGVLSARSGLGGAVRDFTLSAQIQPGNSGGPVLDRSGRVIGVAVARVADLEVAAATGSLPQNINFAIRSDVLARFLDSNGSAYREEEGGSVDLDGGLPPSLEPAVVAVLCRR